MGRTKGNPLIKVIWGSAISQELGAEELSKKISIPYRTLQRRKKDPKSFSLREIERIGIKLGIPVEELREAAIRY